MKRLAHAAAWCAAAIALHAHAAEPRAWAVIVPESSAVAWRGLASMDGAGGPAGAFLYPAPNAVGLVAAIIAHGLTVEGIKRSEKSALQAAADKVLEPLRPVTDAMRSADLLAQGMDRTRTLRPARLVAANDAAKGEWRVESAPSFALTQDLRSVVLDNAIIVYREGRRETPEHQAVVRVVSSPVPGEDPQAYWLEHDGAALRSLAATLWAESIDIAVEQWDAPLTGPERTLRYKEGGAERMERAQLLRESCGRMLARTLRGEYMSMAARGPMAACDPHHGLGSSR